MSQPKRQPPTGAVFEQCNVVLSEMKAWVAAFTFHCNGLAYDYYFVIGLPQLTERQARDIMENQRFIHEARRFFLNEVVIAPTIH